MMKPIFAALVCVVFVTISLVLSCSQEKRTDALSPPTQPSFSKMRLGTKHVVDTNQELIDVFDDNTSPVLADGDTIYVESGNYSFTDDTFTQRGAKTIYFHGDPSSIPVIEKTGTGAFFDFEDTSPGNHDLEIKNIEFEMEQGIYIENYASVTISGVVSGRVWWIWCDDLLIDSCEFTGDLGILVHENRSGNDADHTIRNSTFAQTGTALSGLKIGLFTDGNAEVVYFNNTYTFERNYDGAAALSILTDEPNSYILDIDLESNDFDNRRLNLAANGSNAITVTYDDNTQDYDQCAEDVMDGGAHIDTLCIHDWNYQGSTYSYDSFGAVTVPEAESWSVCTLGSDETVYVRLQVAGSHAEDNEDIISVIVEYGTTSSYGNSVTAQWCSGESEWQAEFPASAGTMYWRPKATICDETHIGPANSKNRPKKYLCAEPTWYCF